MNKKQAERKARLLPNGKPRYIRCYDNNGETADRYTAVFTGNYTRNTSGEHWYLGMSGDPFHPLGFGQHGSHRTQIDYPQYSHLGKKVTFESLPEPVQKCIMQTYLYLWDLTNEQGQKLAIQAPDPDKWY